LLFFVTEAFEGIVRFSNAKMCYLNENAGLDTKRLQLKESQCSCSTKRLRLFYNWEEMLAE